MQNRIDVELSLSYLSLLVLGTFLITSFSLEVKGFSPSRIHLLMLLSFVLICLPNNINAFLSGKLNITYLIIIILFFFLTLFNVLRSSNPDILSVSISRYGIVLWFYIGISSAVSLMTIQKRGIKKINTFCFYSLSLLLIYFSLTSIPYVDFFMKLNYQFIATQISLISILLTFFLILSISTSNYLKIIIFITSTSSSSYVSLLAGSNAILAIWFTILIIFFIFFFQVRQYSNRTEKQNLLLRYIFFLLIFLFLVYFFLPYITQGTRLETINQSIFLVSSVESRLSFVPNFLDHFSVNPIFGNWDSEILSGSESGEYIHSILLSLLTHTGIVGFLLISTCMLGQIFSNSKASNLFIIMNSTYLISFFLLGSLIAFMTWQVFWFVLGLNIYNQMRKA